MLHPSTASAYRHAPSVVLAVALSLSAAACAPASAPSACAPPGGRLEAASRSRLVVWASRLSYSPRDTTRAFVYGFAQSDSAYVQMVEPADREIREPTRCLVGRLTSSRAYPAAGIGRGANYLWADSLSGGYRIVSIPEDSTVQLTVHPLILHVHELGTAPPATVGLLGACMICGDVRRPYWCRSAFDSATVDRIAVPADLERLREARPPL